MIYALFNYTITMFLAFLGMYGHIRSALQMYRNMWLTDVSCYADMSFEIDGSNNK